MENKRGKVIGFLLIFIVIVGGLLLIKYAPREILSKLSFKNINYSIIIFLAQWIIIMVIIIYGSFRYMRKRKKEKKKIEFSEKLIQKKSSQTDFDVLYNLLKEKRNLNIETIATIFKVKKDIALEWAKILESNDLATVEYPTFGDPEVNLKEEITDERKVPQIKEKKSTSTKKNVQNIKQNKSASKTKEKKDSGKSAKKQSKLHKKNAKGKKK